MTEREVERPRSAGDDVDAVPQMCGAGRWGGASVLCLAGALFELAADVHFVAIGVGLRTTKWTVSPCRTSTADGS